MGRPLKIAKSSTIDSGYNNPSGYGVVGGNTSISGDQILARVAISQTGTGTITATTGSATVTGSGTAFDTQLAAGSVITNTSGTVLGFVDAIANATSMTLTANSAVAVTAEGFVFATNEAGWIVRQKGKTKYLVHGATSGLEGACYTANLANAALTPATMNILGTYANAATGYVESVSDHNGQLFGNVAIFTTFGSAAAADASAGIPYPVVTISKS